VAKKSIFDKQVLALFGGTIGLSVLILGFKVVTAPESCPDIKITVSNIHPNENAPITFSSDKADAKSWEWDFGDGSPHVTTPTANHLYKSTGSYKAKLKINGRCVSDETLISVRRDETNLPEPVIDGPVTAVVGQPVKFSETSGKGVSWEWSFGENPGVDATTQEVTYTYKTAGKKTIELSINGKGKSKVVDLAIDVKPASEKPAGGGGTKSITEAEFTAMLNDVIARKKTNTIFNACLCGKMKMDITVNGKKQSFDSYTTQLNKSNYSTVIKNVTLIKDPKTGCITGIVINDKGGGWHPWRK
jgi:PKD repeat protein